MEWKTKLFIATVMFAVSASLISCATHEEPKTDKVEIEMTVSDIVKEAQDEQEPKEKTIEYDEEECVEEYYEEQYYEEPYYEISYEEQATCDDPSNDWYGDLNGHPTKSEFMRDGVYYDNNYKYTWYSSNVLYHYNTGNWYVDSEGYYRTDEGYLVVASSDYEQGTIIKSDMFGVMQVLDSGCASGTVDVYVNW